MDKTIKFIEKARNKHGDTFDYSLTNYQKYDEKVIIICRLHGEFEQTAIEHIRSGSKGSGNGCKKCRYDKVSKSKLKTHDFFINQCIELFKDKYDYSLTSYKSDREKIKIICHKHGEFEQRPNNHLYGQGCPKCKGGIKSNNAEFIEKSIEKQGNIYDYRLVNYINTKTNVKIICPVHGEFDQKPNKHLSGQGCPKCKFSKGEKEILRVLNKYKIKYEHQKSFNDCFFKKLLKFDFYLPDFNTCVEYDGVQHFNPNRNFGKVNGFLETKNRDCIKNEYCKCNNIKLIRIKYTEYSEIEKIIQLIQ